MYKDSCSCYLSTGNAWMLGFGGLGHGMCRSLQTPVTDVRRRCGELLKQNSCERVVCFELGFASTTSPNDDWSEVMCNPLFIHPLHHYQNVNRANVASREIASFLVRARCVTLLTSDETFISHKCNSGSWGILSILINLILYLFCICLGFFCFTVPLPANPPRVHASSAAQ